MQFNKSSLAFSVFAIMLSTAHAESESDITQNAVSNKLPTIIVQADSDKKAYAAKTASAVLRSKAPLFETAQSISAITNQQIEQKQAKTVAEAFLPISLIVLLAKVISVISLSPSSIIFKSR